MSAKPAVTGWTNLQLWPGEALLQLRQRGLQRCNQQPNAVLCAEACNVIRYIKCVCCTAPDHVIALRMAEQLC